MGQINNYSVYWVHLPEHQNKYMHGYIGISKEIDRRWAGHKRENSNSIRFKHAIKKYGDKLVWEVIHTNLDKELAELIEFEYRPVPSIGWNLRAGGHSPNWAKESIDKSAETRKKRINFVHQIHGTRYCSISELINEFPNVCQSNLSKVANGVYKSTQGWRLQATNITETNDGFIHYNWWHKDHGSRFCTISQLKKEFEFKSPSKLYAVVYGDRKTCNGWKIQNGEI